MIKKALLALIAAGALSVPLAWSGVAWADEPSVPGVSNSNGVRENGVPGPDNLGVPLGAFVRMSAAEPPGALAGVRPGQGLTHLDPPDPACESW